MNSLTVLVLLLFIGVVALALTAWSALAVLRRRRVEPPDEPREVRAGEHAHVAQPRPRTEAPVAKRVVVAPPRVAAEPKPRPATPDVTDQPRATVEPAPYLSKPPTEIKPGRSGRTIREPAVAPVGPSVGETGQKAGGTSVRPRVVVTESEQPRAQQQVEPNAPANETPRVTVKPREVEPNAFDRFIDAERRRS